MKRNILILTLGLTALLFSGCSMQEKQMDYIGADTAKSLALAQVPGATLTNIKEFETDYDGGRLEYEGKIYYDHMEYEFEIDGYSGAIRNWKVESIYD